MSNVMKISKYSYEVTTAANKDLAFSSELASHSIYNIINVSRPVGGASSITINHNLGYTPKTWLFLEEEDGDGKFLSRLPRNTWIDGTTIDYYINDTSIVIEFEDTTNAYTIKVLIFTRSPSV